MNRRGFLSLIGLGTAGLALDPERLLWVPGVRKIFIPPAPAWSFKQMAVPIVISGELITDVEISRMLEKKYATWETGLEQLLTTQMYNA